MQFKKIILFSLVQLFYINNIFSFNLLDSASKTDSPKSLDSSIFKVKFAPDTNKVNAKLDSINLEAKRVQIQEKVKGSGIDTVVNYKANDTIVFNVKSQTMKLRGKSEIKFKNQQLNSEIIEISFKESEMDASGVLDSNKRITGYPKFNDKGSEFYGERIKFNFKTAKGIIRKGETQMGDGFYYGEKIKKISENELFVCDGYYTTCNDPLPHFHFGSSKMKIINEDRVLLDPLVFYVEDLPVMMLPFGLFFPSNGGRQSGLMIPSFFFSKSRGVVFQNLGFYWAASDYWDTQVKVDFYSKGGYMLKNNTRWILRDKFDGYMNFEYGRTKFNLDDPYQTNWRLELKHSQDFTPYDKVVVNLNFTSQNFNRNTLVGNRDFITQSIRSAASYDKTFENNTTLYLSYDRDQNIITDGFNQTTTAKYNIPSTKIFKEFKSLPDWMREITFNYGINANYNNIKRADSSGYTETLIDSVTHIRRDTIIYDKHFFSYDNSQKIQHSPSISISPKLGNFSINPYVNFGLNNYFRKVKLSYNAADSTIKSDTTWGFYSEYNYSFGMNVSTKLYGIADENNKLFWLIKPSDIGIKAFRHVYNPSIGFQIRPDLSAPSLGFYDSYYNSTTKRNIVYSVYNLDGGGIASRAYSSSLNYSDLHSFDIKVKQTDTSDITLELLKLNFSANYDFAKDSLNLSDVSMGFRSPALKFIDLNGSANFRLYNEELIFVHDSTTGKINPEYVTTNDFLFSKGKGLARLTNFNLSLSTTFNSSGIQVGNTNSPAADTTKKDSVEFGERFSKRNYEALKESDLYGDNTPGYTPFSFPWSLTMSLNYSYSKPSLNPLLKSQRIDFNVRGTFKLTNTWNFTFSGGYDFEYHQISVPNLNLTKDLHCWELSFNWVPIGGNSGFNLRLNIKAPQLKDLKYEIQNNPLMR